MISLDDYRRLTGRLYEARKLSDEERAAKERREKRVLTFVKKARGAVSAADVAKHVKGKNIGIASILNSLVRKGELKKVTRLGGKVGYLYRKG
jgi:hypothetical protein